MAHKWARWLHNPYRLGGPRRFKAGGKIRGGQQVGNVRGGGKMRSPGLEKNAEKCGKNAENARKNAA